LTTIAITGATGVFGHGLVPALERDPGVERVTGVARRPFDPASLGWSKLSYRRADVRDRGALADAFVGADAVAHLAFAKFGHDAHEELRAINVEGTLNALHAAGIAGSRRFVFASSVAAYGFSADNPRPITERWPARGSERWFYAREKAELEALLREAAEEYPELELTILRPTIVVGPRTAATWDEIMPPWMRPLARRLRSLPGPLPAISFPHPLQFVHEDDVGEAFRLALTGSVTGTFNLAGDGLVESGDALRELGLAPLPVPSALTTAVARAVVRLPRRPAALEMVEVLTHPVLVDAGRARRELGWQPRYSGIGALRAATGGSFEGARRGPGGHER
jgi:nucleoside-diphosphate-sugar epimerase